MAHPREVSFDAGQERIFANALALLSTAVALEKQSNYLHAAHFSVICLEECAKLLMCCPEIQRLFSDKKRYSHLPKGKLLGVFHFVAGKLSVLYLLKRAHEAGYLGGTEDDFDIVEKDLLRISNSGPIALLTQSVEEFLGLDKFEDQRLATAKRYDEIRKNSVYCDQIDGEFHLPSSRLSAEVCLSAVEDAKFAVGLVEQVRIGRFEIRDLPKIYPARLENLDNEFSKIKLLVEAARAKNTSD